MHIVACFEGWFTSTLPPVTPPPNYKSTTNGRSAFSSSFFPCATQNFRRTWQLNESRYWQAINGFKVVPRLWKKQLWNIIIQSLGLLANGKGVGGEREEEEACGRGKFLWLPRRPKEFIFTGKTVWGLRNRTLIGVTSKMYKLFLGAPIVVDAVHAIFNVVVYLWNPSPRKKGISSSAPKLGFINTKLC